MYGIMFQTKDCKSSTGTLVSKEGQWHWVVNEPEDWVEATSMRAYQDKVPYDVKTFITHEQAERFCKRWPKIYHPWYGEPNGVYKIVEVQPVYKQSLDGYKVVT